MYPDIDLVYASMRRGRDLQTAEIAGRRLCLPFASLCLYPENEICRGLLTIESGTCSIDMMSIPGGLSFSIPGGDTQCGCPGKYIVLLNRGDYWHCVGLNVDDSGECTWYDSEKPCEYVCDVGNLPDMEYWDIAHVALADRGSLHMHPASGILIGGKRHGRSLVTKEVKRFKGRSRISRPEICARGKPNRRRTGGHGAEAIH